MAWIANRRCSVTLAALDEARFRQSRSDNLRELFLLMPRKHDKLVLDNQCQCSSSIGPCWPHQFRSADAQEISSATNTSLDDFNARTRRGRRFRSRTDRKWYNSQTFGVTSNVKFEIESQLGDPARCEFRYFAIIFLDLVGAEVHRWNIPLRQVR